MQLAHHQWHPWAVKGKKTPIFLADNMANPRQWQQQARPTDHVRAMPAHDLFKPMPPRGSVYTPDGRPFWYCGKCNTYLADQSPCPRGCSAKIRRMQAQDMLTHVFHAIDSAPSIRWLLVTDYPDNIPKMWPGVCYDRDFGGNGVTTTSLRENCAILVRCSNRAELLRRVPSLLQCRHLCPVLGIWLEGLTQSVQIAPWLNLAFDGKTWSSSADMRNGNGINWVVMRGSRTPLHYNWVRSIRDQCEVADVPFWFDGWGEWVVGAKTAMDVERGAAMYHRGHYHDFGDRYMALKADTKTTGRRVDSREHLELPYDWN